MKIAVTTESTVDLPKELLDQFNIRTVPFSILIGEQEFKDGEIETPELLKMSDEMKVLPKTSAVNQVQYREFFRECLVGYDALIHVTLSSGISSAYSNAVEIAKEFDNVFVVDSKSLSTGIALLAIYASKLAKEETFTAQEIYDKVQARVDKVQTSFVIKKLNYLHKGGRCSMLSYLGANLLMLRPEIRLIDGKMEVHKKYMGRMDKVIESYAKDILNECPNPDLDYAFITYTTASDGMIEAARHALEERGFKHIYPTHAGATIASHCGENTLGILFLSDAE